MKLRSITSGPALSCTDIITALYFRFMNIDPSEPLWEDRDRLILSKGHACPAVYSALAEKGFSQKNGLLQLEGLIVGYKVIRYE